MGSFDKFKKNQDETKAEPEAYGWDAITEAFEKIYPGQKNPKHYGVIIPWNWVVRIR